MKVVVKEWVGAVPTECEVCRRPLTKHFVDGAIRNGPWAILCLGCHRSGGRGLGKGKGQKFEISNGQAIKVEG